MKFLCEKNTLTNAISIVSRTVSPKSSLAFLEGIYMVAGENLRLTGYNLETGITVCMDAQIRQSGSFSKSAGITISFFRSYFPTP